MAPLRIHITTMTTSSAPPRPFSLHLHTVIALFRRPTSKSTIFPARIGKSSKKPCHDAALSAPPPPPPSVPHHLEPPSRFLNSSESSTASSINGGPIFEINASKSIPPLAPAATAPYGAPNAWPGTAVGLIVLLAVAIVLFAFSVAWMLVRRDSNPSSSSSLSSSSSSDIDEEKAKGKDHEGTDEEREGLLPKYEENERGVGLNWEGEGGRSGLSLPGYEEPPAYTCSGDEPMIATLR